MKKYKSYCKRGALASVVAHNAISGDDKKISFWDFSQWPKWWESGAAELEKSAPGKIITAPVRLPAAVLSATQKTVEEVPGVVRNAGAAIPIIAIAAALLGTGFLVYKFKLNKKTV
jgi:hypothetical protein